MIDAELLEEAKQQTELYTDAVSKGKLSINHVRDILKLNPIEGGDVKFVITPTGAVPVDNLDQYFHSIPEVTHE